MDHRDDFEDSNPFADLGDESGFSAPPPAVVLTGPPLGWLAAGALSAAVGGVLAWLGGSLAVAVLGWLLAGPVGLTLVAWYVNRDNRAKVAGVYQAPVWAGLAYWVGVAACVAGVALAALRVAEGVGRL